MPKSKISKGFIFKKLICHNQAYSNVAFFTGSNFFSRVNKYYYCNKYANLNTISLSFVMLWFICNVIRHKSISIRLFLHYVSCFLHHYHWRMPSTRPLTTIDKCVLPTLTQLPKKCRLSEQVWAFLCRLQCEYRCVNPNPLNIIGSRLFNSIPVWRMNDQ